MSATVCECGAALARDSYGLYRDIPSNALHSCPVPVDDRESVWLCAGLTRRWRVCSYERDYGEFDGHTDAVAFLRLLVVGNPALARLGHGELYPPSRTTL